MAPPTSGAAWLTRPTLNSTRQKSLLIEIEQDFLSQIRRILPAGMAGYCLWKGELDSSLGHPEIWVKWHWYFDEKLKQFVIPLHGITSNVVLVEPTGMSLSDDAVARHLHRRIRRRHDWRPWVKLHQAKGTLPADPVPPGGNLIRPGQRPPPRPRTPLDVWEPEEIQIIELIRIGHRRKQIAAALEVSVATLDRRLGIIRGRLGATTYAAMVESAIRQGLI